MKKFLFILAFFICAILPVNADVMPYYVNNINPNSIGVYQASSVVNVYKEPNEKSTLLFSALWDNKSFSCPQVSASNLFVVFLPKKELAFLTVTDENDSGDWLQISYIQDGIKHGWIKKDDEFKYMNWRVFFNMYGRKYGMYYFKDAPEETKTIWSNNAEDAQNIGKITYPRSIKLTTVRGNWILVIALDVDRSQKIGWIKWRDISGAVYLFPDIK